MVRGILSDLHEPRETMTEPELVHTIKEFSDNFYIRISLMNMADTLSRVLQVFAGNSLDVESIMHPEFDVSHETEAGVSRTLLIITGPTCHTQIKKIAEQINQQVKLATVCSFFRYLR
jgi:acetolactate synthase small subunit